MVRHAATAWTGRRYCGTSDPWLSAEGRETARALGMELAASLSGPVQVVSSPRRRARQTARAIADALGVGRVSIDPRWAESDCGRMEGCTFEQIERHDPGLAARLAAGEIAIDWPDGETAAALETRVRAALADIDRLIATGVTAVIVTHAGPIRWATAGLDPVDVAGDPFPAPATARVIRGRPVLRSSL